MPDIRTPWRAVAAAFALNGILLGTWASRIPAVVERHGLGEAGLGAVLLSMGIGALLSFPLAGRLSDGVGAVRVTRWIAVGYLATLVLVAIAPGPVWLAAALFFFGGTHGAMDVCMNSWATEVEKASRRSVMSSFHAMWSFGAGIGAGIGFAAVHFSLPLAVHFTGVAVLAAVLFGPFMAFRWTSQTRPRGAADPVFALPRGPLLLVGIIALASGLGEGAMADWSAVFLTDVTGAGEAPAALGYAVFSVTMVAMRLTVDRLVTRFGPVRVARASGLIAAAGLVLVIVPATLTSALLGFALMGVGYAALIPVAFSRAASDPHVPPGQGIAAVATLGYGALLMGPPVIGLVAEVSSLRLAFAGLAAVAVVVSVLAPVLSRSPKGSAQTA